MFSIKKNKIISFEGNISAGKSTIFEYVKTLNRPYSFVDEPVSDWLAIKDKDGKNALECFYADQKKNSFCFQVLAYITRLKKIINTITNNPNIVITERCLETDKYVFAKMLYEAGNISSIEWETYNYWFNSFIDEVKVDLIIYIKTDPYICYERIKKRNRVEEKSVPLDYLLNCHAVHEEWINSTETKVCIVDGNKTIDEIKIEIHDILNNL